MIIGRGQIRTNGHGTAPDAVTMKYTAANVIPSNITLYAIWRHPDTITITKTWGNDLTETDANGRMPPAIKIEGKRGS